MAQKQRYGTILMDLQRSQVIDLLLVRSAESFANNLRLQMDALKHLAQSEARDPGEAMN